MSDKKNIEACENCESCKKEYEEYPCLDNPWVEGSPLLDIEDGKADENLSYCYSNKRAPKLWMKKYLDSLKRISESLKKSSFEHIARDMNRFMQVYVNHTSMMSEDVICGMFSILEYCDLQKQMLEALSGFARNHIMEMLRKEIDEEFTWEQVLLMIDCVAGCDFEKSSVIMNRPVGFEGK